MTVQEITLNKRAVFYREHAARTYSPSAYSLSEALVEVPYLLAQSILYSLLVSTKCRMLCFCRGNLPITPLPPAHGAPPFSTDSQPIPVRRSTG